MSSCRRSRTSSAGNVVKIRSVIYEQWLQNRSGAISAFPTLLVEGDHDALSSAIDAFNELDCWAEVLNYIANELRTDLTLGDALLLFWTIHGFSLGEALNGDWHLLVEALRKHLPAYSGPAIWLYRGELRARHETGKYGIAWTPVVEKARQYLGRRHGIGEGPSLVLATLALPEAVIAGPCGHSKDIGDHEYVLDPRMLLEVRIL